ncbi:alpha/beta hydrolase [candidate division KSB1 bacterium]|nr:alpha/beta hydrolase [candidate division KSB1 bacterium]
MPTIQSRIVIGLIKNRHLFKMRLKPEVVDAGFSVDKFRKEVDKATAKMKMPKSVTTRKQTLNTIQAEWIVPEQPVEGKILLYIHGGGFISGSCQTHRMHVAKFAQGCRLTSLVFDYRLAPEHPFPAAVDDCVAVYQWLLENGYRPEDIVVGGESAGGTLTLSLLLALKQKKIGLPKAAFSISPVTDLRCLADSFRYNAKNDIAPMGSWDVWTKLYIADNDPTLPLLSPLMGDFSGLPPLHICVGTHEIHLDDCVNVAQKAKEQGMAVTLSKWEKMVHAFPLFSPLFPEATKALTEICNFVKNQIHE